MRQEKNPEEKKKRSPCSNAKVLRNQSRNYKKNETDNAKEIWITDTDHKVLILELEQEK